MHLHVVKLSRGDWRKGTNGIAQCRRHWLRKAIWLDRRVRSRAEPRVLPTRYLLSNPTLVWASASCCCIDIVGPTEFRRGVNIR